MNEDIIKEISSDLNISIKQIDATLKLLGDGNTIPFIARYRKEATGNLNEEEIRKINDVYEYQVNLLKRKEDVIRLIDEKGLLTDELKQNIMNCSKLVEIEDIYRPFKEKKKTKATEAIKNGLEPLAKIIMSFPIKLNDVEKFLNDNVKTKEEAIIGAKYIIVSEAGASVYSASKLAISEFPNLHVEERSAISIARRLQDPLSELVKVDSKSIGVGLYQHDVVEKRLDESLDFVVTKAVNQVGVNINTASPSLLKYVSGLNKKVIDKIIGYRDEKGKFISREELKKKKILSEKVYEQAIGFMRIVDGVNPLDKTSIHTESYDITNKLLQELSLDLNDIGTPKIKEVLNGIDIDLYAKKLNTDKYTLADIVASLSNPLRDPRDDMPKPILRSDVLKLEDLTIGMKLQGTVRNVVDFGVFIDIGLKNDGLVHISKISNSYIKHPSEVLSVGDIVDCYVDEIHLDKKKVSLSLLKTI